VGPDGPGEHQPLEIAPDPNQVPDLVAVGDPGGVLLDDRPGIKVLGDVVGRRSDQLDAALPGPLVRIRAREGRQ
jgi:hypothetical protein